MSTQPAPNFSLEPTAAAILFATGLEDSALLRFVSARSPSAATQFGVR